MPGDVITAQVYAKHYGATGSSGNLAGFASALLTAFGLPAPLPEKPAQHLRRSSRMEHSLPEVAIPATLHGQKDS